MPVQDPDLPAVPVEILVSQFRRELEKIKDPELRETTIRVLVASPTWFWFIPAALGGKNHPPDECGIGGLVHHTKKVAFFTRYLLRLYGRRDEDVADKAIAAALMHDCLKYGGEDSTFAQAWTTGRNWSKTHPISCARHAEKYGAPAEIVDAIASHYGPFLETPLSKWKKDGPIDLIHILYLSDGLSASPYNQQPFSSEELVGGIAPLKLDRLKERLLNIESPATHVALSPIVYHTIRDQLRKEVSTTKGITVECLPAHGHSVVRVVPGENELSRDRLFSDTETSVHFIASF